MKITPTALPDVKLVEPVVHGDARGFFTETWRQDQFARAGIDAPFVQDSMSRSAKGVLRGLHYQIQHAQGKLVRVVAGEVFDVAVDLRRSSPTFGRWIGERLSASNHRSLWIPAGFGHGFYVLEDAVMLYKQTDTWSPEFERRVRWNDPELAIAWPIDAATELVLSDKDRYGASLSEAEVFA